MNHKTSIVILIIIALICVCQIASAKTVGTIGSFMGISPDERYIIYHKLADSTKPPRDGTCETPKNNHLYIFDVETGEHFRFDDKTYYDIVYSTVTWTKKYIYFTDMKVVTRRVLHSSHIDTLVTAKKGEYYYNVSVSPDESKIAYSMSLWDGNVETFSVTIEDLITGDKNELNIRYILNGTSDFQMYFETLWANNESIFLYSLCNLTYIDIHTISETVLDSVIVWDPYYRSELFYYMTPIGKNPVIGTIKAINISDFTTTELVRDTGLYSTSYIGSYGDKVVFCTWDKKGIYFYDPKIDKIEYQNIGERSDYTYYSEDLQILGGQVIKQ